MSNIIESKPRTLSEICKEEDFHTEVKGNIYCRLSLIKKIECPYMNEDIDNDGLYPCLRPDYNKDIKLN